MPQDNVEHPGPIVGVNPLLEHRPVDATFEYTEHDGPAVSVRRARTVRDRAGRLRSEFEIASIPGAGTIRLVSIHDPVAKRLYAFVDRPGGAPTQCIEQQIDAAEPAAASVNGEWSLTESMEPQPEKMHGFSCERFAGTNAAGERLEAWVSQDYGLNLKETVSGPDGKAQKEWRLVRAELAEPDPALFAPPQ
jgi:hypothetical protein